MRSHLTGAFTGGGYVAVNEQSMMYPSIAVNKDGKGAIGFSIVGRGMFPGTGYAKVSLATGATEVKLTSRGVFPDDGFTGYPVFDDRGGRWGDYSAAVVDANGDIWVANEPFPVRSSRVRQGMLPQPLANWGTLVAKINISARVVTNYGYVRMRTRNAGIRGPTPRIPVGTSCAEALVLAADSDCLVGIGPLSCSRRV